MPAARKRERDSEADHRPLLPDGGGDEMSGEGGGSGLAKDRSSILLLLLLYVLQGIPLGLAGSIPMILQNRHVTYKDQATFSLSFWPFSIKLLWAPLVDSVFLEGMGRRKSWLVPAQYLIGGFMLMLSSYIDVLLGEGESHTPNVGVITTVFFMLNFLAATQDIAVDGWALTMLSRENVGWASTCNSVGQTAGYFLGYVVFLALESEDFCVHYLGQSGSLVTLSGFLYFWGILFWITTTIVWVLKHEEPSSLMEKNEGLVGTYSVLGQILKKKTMWDLILVLLTCKIGFAASDALTGLKLIEIGVPKDRLALLSIPIIPVQILLPLYISRHTAGPRPLDPFILGYPLRLVFGLVFAGVVYVTPLFRLADGSFPFHYYGLIIAIYLIHQVFVNCMFVGVMAFFARISDSSVGGTYMTLLNTFTNLGGNWPSWVALRFVSELTWTSCLGASQPDTVSSCASDPEKQLCEEAGGSCATWMDGYYVETVVLVIVGFLWMRWGLPTIKRLQSLPVSDWAVSQRTD
uniref:Major facilitator superfamily (MFS) profile domain-containing protein n=1 Tax=Scylla olivacea TaxID=85551 RepID=A0A0P4WHW8_SCYOL